MGDWGSDYESAVSMVGDATAMLQAINPEHELLKYWFLSEEDIDPTTGKAYPEKENQNRVDFYNRFWKKEISWEGQPGLVRVTVTMTNYLIELEEAIKQIADAQKETRQVS